MEIAAFKQRFQRIYHDEPTAVSVAPGRVNLIGEHTDYNGGFVLPCALDFKTKVAFKGRCDSMVRVTSINYHNEQVSFDLSEPLAPGSCHWANYVMGVYYAFISKGYSVQGADLVISGNVPQGAGLSSSAALEVALAGAIAAQNNLNVTSSDIALLGQFSENQFLGCQTGIMDQMIAAHGKKDHALLMDCEDLSIRQIPVHKDFRLLVVNSNFKRTLVGSEYNQRRRECEEAASALDVPSLRYATLEKVIAGQSSMSKNAFKRALHVVSENDRTLAAAEALEHNDFKSLRELMFASHDSLRDNFEVTVPATDYLVEIIKGEAGESGAARMTGGGFGGAVVALLLPDAVERVISAVLHQYPKQLGIIPDIYKCEPGEGMHLV